MLECLVLFHQFIRCHNNMTEIELKVHIIDDTLIMQW
jgi:hypothetical protein